MKAPKRIDDGTIPVIGEQKAWQWYAAKEVKDGGARTINDIENIIRKYADPMIETIANVPIQISLRTQVPGTPDFQLICSNVIQVGQERALAKKDLTNPMFLQSFLLEGRRAWPIGYKEGLNDHKGALILP